MTLKDRSFVTVFHHSPLTTSRIHESGGEEKRSGLIEPGSFGARAKRSFGDMRSQAERGTAESRSALAMSHFRPLIIE